MTGSGPGGGSPTRGPAATSASGWASRSTTSSSPATRSGCATTTSGASARPRPRAPDPLLGRNPVEEFEEGAHRHARAALRPVPGRLARVVGRPGHVEVDPRDVLDDELGQEDPA